MTELNPERARRATVEHTRRQPAEDAVAGQRGRRAVPGGADRRARNAGPGGAPGECSRWRRTADVAGWDRALRGFGAGAVARIRW
jgi:hypothetical protein